MTSADDELTHEDMGYDASAHHPKWHIAMAEALELRARGHRETAATMESNLRAANEQRRMAKAAEVPVDRSRQQLTDGSPVPPDGSHTELGPSGQQKGYVVLSADERAKGFVRPYRDAYRHLKCGAVTTMGRSLAETYARDPNFYAGTFCATCRAHFPVGEDGEFTWYEMDGRDGPKVGT